MSDGTGALKAAEVRCQALKAAYQDRMAAYLGLCERRSKVADRRKAFWEWHNSALDYFGAFEKVLTAGALQKSNLDPTWYTEQGETAVNLLDTIALHYETAAARAAEDGVQVPPPSRTAFAATQRAARETNPKLALECRDSFVRNGLPTHGFDTEETGKSVATPLEPRFFAVGCVLLLVAVVLACWGFSKGELTQDQRNILHWGLPLASGFASWSFAGSLSAKARGWQGLIVTATGGFAVWFLSSFVLFR